jgi:hypothetical protein
VWELQTTGKNFINLTPLEGTTLVTQMLSSSEIRRRIRHNSTHPEAHPETSPRKDDASAKGRPVSVPYLTVENPFLVSDGLSGLVTMGW